MSESEVLSVALSLKNSQTRDIYGLNSNLIKAVIMLILSPLTFCINRCLEEGVFPSFMKLSRVVPVYKKGEKNLPSSYRPISCIPTMAKILKILKSRYVPTLNVSTCLVVVNLHIG